MNKLHFVTSNKRKIKDAQDSCTPYGIVIEPVDLQIDEIQNKDGRTVAEHKALAAFRILQKPLVVNDAFWEIPALGGFPGPHMKDINSWFMADDWLKLIDGKDRTIICHENIVYINELGQLHFFTHTYNGLIVKTPQGSDDYTVIHTLVSLDEGKTTLAWQRDNGPKVAREGKDCWVSFAKWYKSSLKI